MDIFQPDVILSDEFRNCSVEKLKKIPPLIHLTPTKFAAVLIPLCVVNDEVHLLYTLRSKKLKNHSGQVSFPGGMTDGEETALQTALRETEEELGLPREKIDVWTEMAPLQATVRAIVITPVVGVIKDYKDIVLKPNPDEVDEVFTVPLTHFCDHSNQGYINLGVKNISMPVFCYKNHKIWGATGLMTHMFLLNLLPEDMYSWNMEIEYELKDLMSKL